MFTYTVTQSVTPASGIVSYSKAYTNAYTQELKDEAIADGASQMQVNFAFLVASVIVMYMVSTVDTTVEINTGGSGSVIDLVTNVPYLWTMDSYDAFRFTTDVTALFLTNNSAGEDGVFNIRCLSDATP